MFLKYSYLCQWKYKWRWSVYRIDDISMTIQLISNIYCNQILSVQSLFWRTKTKSRLYNHNSISNNWNNLFGTKIKEHISNIFLYALFNGSNGSDVRGYINIIADLQSMDYVSYTYIRLSIFNVYIVGFRKPTTWNVWELI